MAINYTSALLEFSGNQIANSDGKPVKLLHSQETIEPTPDGNPLGRVLNLGYGEGCWYGDLKAGPVPPEATGFANIKVSDKVDYEISFWFYQAHDNPSIELSAFGKNERLYPTRLFDIRNNQPNNYFLRYPEKACGTPKHWHFATFIVYRHDIDQIEQNYTNKQPQTSLGVGTNLVMEKGTSFLNIRLINNSAKVKLYNFVVKPLRTPFSTGFLQASDMIELWTKINNKELTVEDFKRIAQQKLLNYNLAQANIQI